MTACNYNPDATQDDNSCTPAKDGFDCNNNKLAPDLTGSTFFIRTQVPTMLTKGLSHAEVDLPENLEVGFEVTPGSTPVKGWSNIIHFTATGKVWCELASADHTNAHGRIELIFLRPTSIRRHSVDKT